MEWTKLPRKLSILTLSLGVTAGMIPGSAFAAKSLQTPSSYQTSSSLTQNANQTYISPQLNTKSSDDVRVIVQLSGQPAAVGKYAAKQGISALSQKATEANVKSQQADVLDKAEDQGIDLTVNYQYNTVLNGFEVSLPANKIPELAKISGVTSIYPNSTWYVMPDETVTEATYRNDNAPLEQIHANWAWNQGFTGAGLKVGVIDTGIDYLHPDLAAAYKGGYDSFYNDNDPYEEEPLSVEEDPYGTGYAGTSHGTHVSGTIVGQYTSTGDVAQKGVASGAELYVYKVLGRNLKDPSTSSGSSAQVIDGIERAVKDGMDVINLSLGSDSEKDVNSPDSIAINNAVLSGVVAVIANGNNGEDGYFSLGSPAVSQLAISVGAVTSPIKAYSGSFKAEIQNSVTSVTYNTYHPFNVMAFELGEENFADIIGTEPTRIVYADLGSEDDYPAEDITGSIVLLSRGELGFDVKIATAKEHGAKAVVIFNGNAKKDPSDPTGVRTIANLDETYKDREGYIGTNLSSGYEFVPTFDIEGKTGRQLARAILASKSKSVYFTFDTDYNLEYTTGDDVTYFSSWGPSVDGNLSIKPDIVAPGDGVLSTYPAYGGDYSQAYHRSSGTSMATPHVAGLSLLIKQAHPDYSPFDIRAALANTADPLLYDGAPEDLYIQGPGRANVENAIKTPALLEALEPIAILDKNYVPQNIINYNPSTSFGTLLPGSEASKALQLKNISNNNLTYAASVVWNYGDADNVTATLDKTSITASARSAATFNLKVNVSSDTEPQMLQGNVVLTAEGQPTLHLPFAINVDNTLQQPDWGTGIQEAAINQPIVYSNNSGILTYNLKAPDINYYEVDLVGLDDVTKGYFKYYATSSSKAYFAPGEYSTVISSTYHPYDDNGEPILDASGKPAVAHLTDGVYKLQVLGINAEDNTKLPIKIDQYSDEFYTAYTSFTYVNSPKPSLPDTGNGGGGGGGGTAPTTPATTGTTLNAGLLTETAGSAGVKPTATVNISETALTAALQNATETAVSIDLSDVDFAKYNEVSFSFTTAQAEKLKASGKALSFTGTGFSLLIPAATLPDFITGSGLTLTLGLAASADTATLAGSSTAIDLGSSTLFVKNGWTSGKPVILQLALDKDGLKDVHKTAVYKQTSDGTWAYLQAGTLPKEGVLQFTVTADGSYTAAVRNVSFKDISSTPWAKDAIEILAAHGIVAGKGTDGSFKPSDTLTRGELLTLFDRLLGKGDTWASRSKEVAARELLTREEAAIILAEALGADSTSSTTLTFKDIDKISVASRGVVSFAVDKGYLKGMGDNTFNPGGTLTRGQAAAILARVLEDLRS